MCTTLFKKLRLKQCDARRLPTEMFFVRKSIKTLANRQSHKDAGRKAVSLAQAAVIERRREKCEVCLGNFSPTQTPSQGRRRTVCARQSFFKMDFRNRRIKGDENGYLW